MKISRRIIIGTTLISLIFSIFAGILISYELYSAGKTKQLVEQAEPALDTLEQLRVTVYEDYLVVQEFLTKQSSEQVTVFDSQFEMSSKLSDETTTSTKELIDDGTISSQQVITSYNNARDIFDDVQKQRDAVIALHKESLIGSFEAKRQLPSAEERYVQLNQQAVSELTKGINELQERNEDLRASLFVQEQVISFIMIFFFVVLIIASVGSGVLLTKRITKPLDDIITHSQVFAEGNYKKRIPENAEIEEIADLQKRVNQVFDIIEEQVTKNPEEAAHVKMKLLPPQYVTVLDFIKEKTLQNKAVTITDIKKHLSLTHPTVQSRLKYLEDQNLITMQRHGRQKIITLVDKND